MFLKLCNRHILLFYYTLTNETHYNIGYNALDSIEHLLGTKLRRLLSNVKS